VVHHIGRWVIGVQWLASWLVLVSVFVANFVMLVGGYLVEMMILSIPKLTLTELPAMSNACATRINLELCKVTIYLSFDTYQ
jgi:hypothetical protein